MPSYDLFEMARANAAKLAEDFNASCADGGPLAEFAQRVATESRLSVTMKFSRLRALLDLGHYRNPWEETHADAGGDPIEAERLMRDRQGAYYARRALFDGSFEQGRSFHYGALYLDGRALLDSTYGTYCVVFTAAAAGAWRSVAWVPDNSLLRYVDENAREIDMTRLQQEVGTHDGRQHVAGIKHAAEVADWERNEWGSRLCHDGCFVEGIVADTLSCEDMERRVIADRTHWQQLLAALDAVLDGDTVTDAQSADAGRFMVIREALMRHDLTVEAC